MAATAEAIPNSNSSGFLYPFGLAEGDIRTLDWGRQLSPPIILSVPVRYFSETLSNLRQQQWYKASAAVGYSFLVLTPSTDAHCCFLLHWQVFCPSLVRSVRSDPVPQQRDRPADRSVLVRCRHKRNNCRRQQCCILSRILQYHPPLAGLTRNQRALPFTSQRNLQRNIRVRGDLVQRWLLALCDFSAQHVSSCAGIGCSANVCSALSAERHPVGSPSAPLLQIKSASMQAIPATTLLSRPPVLRTLRCLCQQVPAFSISGGVYQPSAGALPACRPLRSVCAQRHPPSFAIAHWHGQCDSFLGVRDGASCCGQLHRHCGPNYLRCHHPHLLARI